MTETINIDKECPQIADAVRELFKDRAELQKENKQLRQENQKMRIQRHEDVNYLAKIAMEYKAINEIFKKSLKEAKHSVEYTTIVKMGNKIGVDWE